MSTNSKHVSLAGSHRNAVLGSSVIGPVHPHERIEVTVRIRPRADPPPRPARGHGRGAHSRPALH